MNPLAEVAIFALKKYSATIHTHQTSRSHSVHISVAYRFTKCYMCCSSWSTSLIRNINVPATHIKQAKCAAFTSLHLILCSEIHELWGREAGGNIVVHYVYIFANLAETIGRMECHDGIQNEHRR